MASKRRLRRKQCGSKRRYANEAEAHSAIGTLRHHGLLQGYVEPYRCDFCNGFHFGHPPGARTFRP